MLVHKVLILDTSLLCVWLAVPSKETCGHGADIWTTARVDALIRSEIEQGATLVLPLASIIETGNHIAQASKLRHEKAKDLADLIAQTADARSPWAAFSSQVELWEPKALKQLANDWVSLATQQISLGDAAIKGVAEYYARLNIPVQILTADQGLKAFEPVTSSVIPQPRRRRSR
jgi:hypothetical protein